MSLTTRLLDSLKQSAQTLDERPALAAAVGLQSVTLVGSLARDDFIVGGSDVDLLLVHGLGEHPSSEIGRRPEIRAILQLFGEPLLRLAGGTGRQKPFLIDCHFADAQTVAAQPQWADPAGFLREHMARDRFLWIYAFDLVAHSCTLWGEPPACAVSVFPVAGYLPYLVRQLREDLALLESYAIRPDPPERQVNQWKSLQGQLITLVALKHGCESLLKHDLYRTFNLHVAYFPGKDWAAAFWAEYLRGSVFHQRDEWLRRSTKFCENALGLLDS